MVQVYLARESAFRLSEPCLLHGREVCLTNLGIWLFVGRRTADKSSTLLPAPPREYLNYVLTDFVLGNLPRQGQASTWPTYLYSHEVDRWIINPNTGNRETPSSYLRCSGRCCGSRNAAWWRSPLIDRAKGAASQRLGHDSPNGRLVVGCNSPTTIEIPFVTTLLAPNLSHKLAVSSYYSIRKGSDS